MRVFSALLSILFAVSLGAMAPASVKAERVFREAWGCVIEVGSPYVTRGSPWRVYAGATANCRERTRFERAVVRLMRVRRGARDEVVAVDRVPQYWHVRRPINFQWPEAWGASVHVRTRCRRPWTVSDPRLYTRAIFKKAGQSKRVVVTTDAWSGKAGETCRRR